MKKDVRFVSYTLFMELKLHPFFVQRTNIQNSPNAFEFYIFVHTLVYIAAKD